MDVLMLVQSDVAHDARVLREAQALAEQGHAIHIVGKDIPEGWTPPAGVTVQSASGGSGFKPSGGGGGGGAGRSSLKSRVRTAARWALLPQHRQRVWRTWNERARAAVSGRRFDVVHAHDFNVLRLAADLADGSRARLVYDSHEWWSGRERHGRPTPLERAREKRIERRIVARADAVLTVSPGIADLLGRWRGGPVTVVRNSFPSQKIPAGEPGRPSRPRGVVYAGRIGAARDIETLLEAASALQLDTVLMGKADREFLPKLRVAQGTVRIEPARPVDEVDEVLRRVGISVVTLTDTCENHRLALPNKVFHAVRAGVPVVAADLPELRRLVTSYGIGALYRPGDAESMRAALRQVTEDYTGYCDRVAQARGELSWDHDAKALVGVYESLAGAAGEPAVSAGVR
ncbi:MAG TPA: glycosyltransferase [Actinocrinis sp.]|jgi:glycosyltransferase involved in cell wall biosynthesis|uniref:glycosyltransferase n=1 Tax=Actinocrinis sp. TaxID=1920516 RepID=UPI002DDD0B62|nr:glycosyltransferase [Actinocrinis sp.]HEV3172178.1 glycosyltransferase [Actinocrinis sp.]